MVQRNRFLPAALAAILMAPALWAQPADKSAQAAEVSEPRYYIGVAVESIPPLMAEQLQLETNQGLNIQRIVPESPAEAAKLQAGDLMIQVNDQPLTSQDQLNQTIRPKLVDGKWQPMPIALDYLRKGVRHTVTLMPALRPGNLLPSGPPTIISSSAVPKTYAGPDGVTHQVGTGYLIDTQNSSALLNQSINALTLGGQTVILKQESDGNGQIKVTVTLGNEKPRVIDPAHLEALPENLRNLVKPLLTPPAPAPIDIEQLQDRVRLQDQQIKDLQAKLDELLKSQPKK